jgi:cyclopropane-fatty-acyl-phospholipid synthase
MPISTIVSTCAEIQRARSFNVCGCEVWEAAVERLLVAFLRRYIRRGTVQVTTAAGHRHTFGDGSGAAVAVRLRSASAQRAVLFDPQLKLGDASMDGSLVV